MMSPLEKPSTNEAAYEENLRKELRGLLQQLTRREPLEMNYKFLLLNGKITPRKPIFRKDKLYKDIPANLRKRVEAFGTVHEWDRVSQRKLHKGEPFDEKSLRDALSLVEPKKHEQEPLLKATLDAMKTPEFLARKDLVEGMALGLQSKELKALQKREESQHQTKQKNSQLEQKKRQQSQFKKRRKRELEELQEEEVERQRKQQRELSPNHRLSKFLYPFFQKLWNMEFANLNNMNPFRIVIDKGNCAQMGAPDYFDIIKEPMNLTYIKQKLDKAQYELKGFFADVDLMLDNCLLYNSNPANDYHIAAKEMRELHRKLRRQAVAILRKKQAKK